MTDNLLQNSSCPGVNRRDFFSRFGTGLKGIALASLLSPDLVATESKPPKKNFADLKPRPPHFRTRAKAVIQLFMNGDVDYLVATDAIGMGLNLDVAHVAFASLRKFDGRRARRLTVAEMAQIAGRPFAIGLL